jgi:2',3'-cyclic-nucleotide 2'-phosphodiesterase (5'-nucleotidase family)
MATGVNQQQSLIKAQLISRAYKHMGVAAINVGDADLTQGLTFLRNEASKGLPLISANLIDPASKLPIFSPYTVKKIGKIRIALFGLASPVKNQAIHHPAENTFIVRDPVKSARKTFKMLHRKADVIILLSNLDAKSEREVIRAVPGIHFVLGGREGRFIETPLWEGHTPILESYKKGMYAGTLHLTFVKASSPFQYEVTGERLHGLEHSNVSNRFSWTLVPLHALLPEDRKISSWIHKSGIKKD